MMRALASKPGFAAIAAGIVVLLHLLAIGTLLQADLETVSFQGHVLPEVCSWKTVYGIPCPTCGMTRGTVMAIQGRLADSYAVNRSAPILAGSAFLTGLGLLLTGTLQMRSRYQASYHLGQWTRRLGLAGGGLWLAMLAVNWTLVLRA